MEYESAPGGIALEEGQPESAEEVAVDQRRTNRRRIPPWSEWSNRARFTVATLAGGLAVLPIYLWVLWDLWNGSINPLRAVVPDDFYDLQARSMFHGHLDVATNSLGIEGFIHDGRTYTYFGVFPSIIRMPVLLFTSALDGKLTAPSLLLAWLITGLAAALLTWRLRILIRGESELGRGEACSYGLWMATVLGGSVALYVAANPSVYNEDFAWSIALTTSTLFALLGMVERPTARGAWAVGLLVLAASLNRSPTGYACEIGAFLVAGWFALGRFEPHPRKWAWPMATAGGVGLLASCLVTYGKFGLPFGLPMADQVWAHVNAHRRYFLAANGGKAFSLSFLPSTLSAYLNPGGIRLERVFPFFATPVHPAPAIGGVVLDQTYSTSSVPTSMPIFFVLGIWGVITTFRPHGPGRVRLARLMVVTSMIATAGVLVWGYIANRYLCDLLPFLIIASAIGLIDVWRRLDVRASKAWAAGQPWTARRRRRGVTYVLAIAVVVEIAINAAVTMTPSTWFSPQQNLGFVSMQHTLTPVALSARTIRTDHLASWAPGGTLAISGKCAALYRSSGDSYRNSPGQLIEHAEWVPVEQSSALTHVVTFGFNQHNWQGPPVALLRFDQATLDLKPMPNDSARLVLEHPGDPQITWPERTGFVFAQIPTGYYTIDVTTDPYLHSIVVDWYGETMINHYLQGSGPAQVLTTPPIAPGAPPHITVGSLATPGVDMSLCQTLLQGAH